MPEGHTIHRIARDHQKWLAGQKLTVTSPQGRFSVEAKRLSGRNLLSVEAHGKHLFYLFGNDCILHIHLGLYGKFRFYKIPAPEPRGEVRVRMIGETHGFDLNGPNQCELITQKEVQQLRSRLGVDPLSGNSDPGQLWQKLQRSKRQIGSVLLDQSLIAGVGNIFRAEILFMLGIHPNRSARDLTREEFEKLWDLTQNLLEIGVRYNRIITVSKKDIGKRLSLLTNEERLHIYKKTYCPRCTGPVNQTDSAGRILYFCPNCQH